MMKLEILAWIGLTIWTLAGVYHLREIRIRFLERRRSLGKRHVDEAVDDIVKDLNQRVVKDHKTGGQKLTVHTQEALKRGVDANMKNYASYRKIARQLGLKNKKAAREVIHSKVEAKVGELKR